MNRAVMGADLLSEGGRVSARSRPTFLDAMVDASQSDGTFPKILYKLESQDFYCICILLSSII